MGARLADLRRKLCKERQHELIDGVYFAEVLYADYKHMRVCISYIHILHMERTIYTTFYLLLMYVCMYMYSC